MNFRKWKGKRIPKDRRYGLEALLVMICFSGLDFNHVDERLAYHGITEGKQDLLVHGSVSRKGSER